MLQQTHTRQQASFLRVCYTIQTMKPHSVERLPRCGRVEARMTPYEIEVTASVDPFERADSQTADAYLKAYRVFEEICSLKPKSVVKPKHAEG